jgi:hypothetical protein
MSQYIPPVQLIFANKNVKKINKFCKWKTIVKKTGFSLIIFFSVRSYLKILYKYSQIHPSSLKDSTCKQEVMTLKIYANKS